MVAVISGADNGSLFMPSGVLTFSRPFAILSFYRKQLKRIKVSNGINGSVLKGHVSENARYAVRLSRLMNCMNGFLCPAVGRSARLAALLLMIIIGFTRTLRLETVGLRILIPVKSVAR